MQAVAEKVNRQGAARIAPPSSSHEIALLFAAAKKHVASLAGEIGAHQAGWITPDRDNRASISALHQAIRSQFPEAGKAYWATRCWNMLTWQPAVLAVLAVHGLGFLPDLRRLSQRPAEGMVAGYRLPHSRLIRSGPEHLIEQAGGAVAELCGRLFADLGEVATVKPLNAKRLLADRILGSLAHLPQMADGPDTARTLHYAELWLEAASLSGMSSLAVAKLSNGREQPVLDRKACCLHYCVPGAELCASCPKQPDAVRFARMREYWEAEADA